MQKLVKLLIRVFFLKAKPQDIPYSTKLLTWLIAFAFVFKNYVNFYFFGLVKEIYKLDLSLQTSLIITAVSYLLLYIVIYVILDIYKLKNRLIQVLSAMFGIEIILTGFYFLLILLLQLSPMAVLLIIVLLYWQFMVTVHIFANSFDFSILKSGLFALAYMSIQYNISELLFNYLG